MKVSAAGNPTLLEVTLHQWGVNTLVSDVFPALENGITQRERDKSKAGHTFELSAKQ